MKTDFQKQNHVYMVIFKIGDDTRFNITYNKKSAISYAKEKSGKIRFLSRGLWRDCGYSMDYPTFYAQSDELTY